MKLVRRIILIILLIIIIVVGSIVYMGYRMYQDAITGTSIASRIEEIQKDENYIRFSEIPEYFKNAIVAVEDHRFYTHNGIDFITTTRSMMENIREKEIVAGGSTITQQVGRLLYFTQEQRFTRKIAELFVAFDLEKNYSKEDILELYCNMIYYGDGYYGLKEASLGYFEKSPQDLTLAEASLLAGLPNAPSVYSPTKNPILAQKRHAVVLTQMVKYDYISEEQKQEIENTFQQ